MKKLILIAAILVSTPSFAQDGQPDYRPHNPYAPGGPEYTPNPYSERYIQPYQPPAWKRIQEQQALTPNTDNNSYDIRDNRYGGSGLTRNGQPVR